MNFLEVPCKGGKQKLSNNSSSSSIGEFEASNISAFKEAKIDRSVNELKLR